MNAGNYARQNRNWLIARDMINHQRKLCDKQMRTTRNDAYYGGIPYWMNTRKKSQDFALSGSCLVVNKLETPPVPERSLAKNKTQFRVTRNPIVSRQGTKSVGVFHRPTARTVIASKSKVKVTSQPILAASNQPVILISDSRNASADHSRSDIYLPAPRILYEVYGPSN